MSPHRRQPRTRQRLRQDLLGLCDAPPGKFAPGAGAAPVAATISASSHQAAAAFAGHKIHCIPAGGSNFSRLFALIRRAPMCKKRALVIIGLVLSGIGFGMSAEFAMAQSPGPISAATAKAAGAKSHRASACMGVCKARGPFRTKSDCAKWCTPGQCYFSGSYEAYCIK